MIDKFHITKTYTVYTMHTNIDILIYKDYNGGMKGDVGYVNGAGYYSKKRMECGL